MPHGSPEMRNPAMPGRVRVIPLLCAHNNTLASLQAQVLVDRYYVAPGFAALVAALAFGEARNG